MRKTALQATFVLTTSLLVVASLYLFFAPQIEALTGIRRTINFQGKLVADDGLNVADGNYSIVFTIYDRATSGTALWTETQGSVAVTDGVFQVELGSATPIPANFNFNWDGLYLGINVASDGEMTPRIRLTAVPYAFNAERVAGLTVQDGSGNASTSGTLRVENNKTISLLNTMTLQGTDSTVFTFPNASGTVATLDSTGEFTNKSIGSTGLTFSGASTDITTASNETLTLAANGSGNFVIAVDPNSGLTLGTELSNEFPLLVRSGIGSNAAVVIDQLNSGNIFAASAAGSTKFVINNNGDIQFTGNTAFLTTLTSATGNNVTLTIPDTDDADTFCLVDLANCAGVGSSNWDFAGGAISSKYASITDLLIGGTASSSADFAVLGVAGNGPVTATLSGNLIVMPKNGAGGNVGIGTTAPTAKLQVASNSLNPSGSELVTNGTFTGNASGWTLQSNCSEYNDNNVTVTYDSACIADANWASLSTTFPMELGKTYIITFTLSGVSNELAYIYYDNSQESPGPFGEGTHSVTYKAEDTDTEIIYFDSWFNNTNGTWTIDNVSIRETGTLPPALSVIGWDNTSWLSLGGDIFYNTALGQGALPSSSYGFYNSAMGVKSLFSNTSGDYNSALGAYSLYSNISGRDNSAIGAYALFANTTGHQNNAFGAQALTVNTTGSSNNAIGAGALSYNTTGSGNTAFGHIALSRNTLGNLNTTIVG